MTANLKGILHFIVNLGGNVVILDLVPADYKIYVLLVFNIIQVIYAYMDPTYTVHILSKKK